jgi:putative ABC transport system permease protein
VSLTILALQQLVQNVESQDRFAILNKLGVEKKSTNQAILVQISSYFLIPATVALVHSSVALDFFNRALHEINLKLPKSVVLSSFGLALGLYLIYFTATYLQSKKMMNSRRQ